MLQRLRVHLEPDDVDGEARGAGGGDRERAVLPGLHPDHAQHAAARHPGRHQDRAAHRAG